MITETHIHTCTKCSSQNIVRNGHNRYGHQQYRCKDCGTCRVLEPKERGYSPERQEEILRIYQERSSMRGVARSTGVSRPTLATWIKKSRSFTKHR
jgi:insertion element IS1 protein InsB